MSAESATVSFRTESGAAQEKPWALVDSTVLSKAAPWRTFRWYKGQRHYSGTYRGPRAEDGHERWPVCRVGPAGQRHGS